MAAGKLPVKVLAYDDLRAIGDRFLQEHHAELTLPIPIEDIVDIRLKVDIVCMPSLQYVCEVDAFINNTCTTIYVDGEVYLSTNSNRLRFSIAHELAHSLLHREVLKQLNFTTMAEWKRVYSAIPADQQEWMEWQAHCLGGLMLVPTKLLRDEFRKAQERLGPRFKNAGMEDVYRYSIETSLADTFAVSREVIQRRLAKDKL